MTFRPKLFFKQTFDCLVCYIICLAVPLLNFMYCPSLSLEISRSKVKVIEIASMGKFVQVTSSSIIFELIALSDFKIIITLNFRTGTNGSVVPKTSKPRFGKIPKKSKTSAPITAHELLQRMKRRSLGGAADNNLFRPDNMTDDIELLTEIRNFVAFQANSAGEGEATTAELLEKFQKKLPPQQSPLFKALLTEICTFQRHHLSNKGVWRLKDEFR